MNVAASLLQLLAVVGLIVGLGMIYVPLAVISASLGVLAVGVQLERRPVPPGDE